MRRLAGYLALVILASALAVTSAWAGKRVALVIGNANYASVGSLRNPLADAAAVAKVLQQLGFEVTSKQNVGAQQFREALAGFAETSAGADLSLVYFAGHGVELDGTNYLIPTDAKLEKKVAARYEAISLDDVREAVAGATKLRVVILDACRNNPFQLAGKDGKRAASRGLARVEPNSNELIAYSAREGTTAADGEGANSPFALALVNRLNEPGVEVGYLFRKVRGDVVAATGGTQEPFVYATLGEEELYFNPPAGMANLEPKPANVIATPAEKPAVPATVDPGAEYSLVKGTSSEQVLLEYIAKHGNAPIWGARAKEDLAALRKRNAKPEPVETEVAIVVPPAPKPEPGGCNGVIVSAGMTGASKDDCLKPGEMFRDVDGGPYLVVVPAGSFMMGTPNESGAQPIHAVTIPRAFAMGRYEVTVDQFAAFVAATDRAIGDQCWTREANTFDLRSVRTFRSPGYPLNGSHPAGCIDWDDAKAYTQWLSALTGRTYRLPSEAEWEYAARAGATTAYSFGDDQTRLCAYANVGDLSATGSLPNDNIIDCQDGYRHSSPAGSFEANPFGLYDMAGNVEEWVEDCLNSSYAGAPADGSAWTTTDRQTCIKVMRGGSWESGFAVSLTPTNRGYNGGNTKDWSLGFRVVREL